MRYILKIIKSQIASFAVSTQIQHKFNKFNEIRPKSLKFYQSYQHKYNTNITQIQHK